jgi:transcription elongation factor GreA
MNYGMSDPRPAPDLLRELGLLVDGPARWGERIRSESPGIYLVEWTRSEERAPIDHGALRSWLERVPGLRLDGTRPTAHDLAERLGSYWLAGETLLYVGQSKRSLRARLAAQVATPLGDRRPYAGGHWLKTLRGVDQARVWWAATDAPEEYADALFDAFAERHGDPGALPFAVLEAPGGRRRAHGLTGALLTEVEIAGPAGTRPVGRAPSRSPGRATATGAGSRSRPASGRTPASASGGRPLASGRTGGRRGATKGPPRKAPEPAYLSEEGIERLRSELTELRETQRPQVIARVRSARELGDLRENAEYHAAREEQSFLEGRILQLQGLLDRAVVVTGGANDGSIALGSTVEVAEEGADVAMTVTIVGTAEADSRAGRVSDRSPMGASLLGHRSGDTVTVRTPGGERRFTIRSVG